MNKLLLGLMLVPMMGYAEGYEMATGPANASGYDGTQPTTAGLIAISAPTNNSADDIGVKFVDPSTIPGLKGTNGTNGTNGAQGATGVAGAKGSTGATGAQGIQGVQGVAGNDAVAPAIDPRLDVEIREYDAEHWSLSSFASFGMQDSTAKYIVGEKLVLKLGKSYESKQIEALRKQLGR